MAASLPAAAPPQLSNTSARSRLAKRPAILQLLHALAQGLQFGAQLPKLGAPFRSWRDADVRLARGLHVWRFRSWA